MPVLSCIRHFTCKKFNRLITIKTRYFLDNQMSGPDDFLLIFEVQLSFPISPNHSPQHRPKDQIKADVPGGVQGVEA